MAIDNFLILDNTYLYDLMNNSSPGLGGVTTNNGKFCNTIMFFAETLKGCTPALDHIMNVIGR